MNDSKLIVALDYASANDAFAMAEQLSPERCAVKVGKELFTRSGPDVVRGLVDQGYRVFLDLKFHDIPNTVANACSAAKDLGVWMMNVHASGGPAMLQAARSAVGDSADRPLLIGVTVLTSLDNNDLSAIGFSAGTADSAARLARITAESGLDGVVCSPQEIQSMRAAEGSSFLLVTPGVRPAGSASGDQKRTMTPGEAVSAGASYLVVGRPITAAPDPMAALDAIETEVAAASG